MAFRMGGDGGSIVGWSFVGGVVAWGMSTRVSCGMVI
jgi:hypothetical protein